MEEKIDARRGERRFRKKKNFLMNSFELYKLIEKEILKHF